MKIIELRRFQARGDSGTIYTVIETQQINRVPMGDRVHEVPGTIYLKLLDDRNVNFIDDNTFKIVRTDEIIRKI